MSYTINKLAKLSGVSVRTLHFYDEIGLLKPAYVGEQGYRFYEEKQLLILQQILFYKELDFELKQIKDIMKKNEADRVEALNSQKSLLRSKISRMQTLMQTIDKTISHLQGKQPMKDKEVFESFGISSEQQKKYEKEVEEYLASKYGNKAKREFQDIQEDVKSWSKENWDKSNKEIAEISQELAALLTKGYKADSKEVQQLIKRHFNWISKFWKPTKETFAHHADFITETNLKNFYNKYHSDLAQFLSEAIKIYANKELK